MEKSLEYWIQKLQLAAHPEGGYFKETYCSPDILSPQGIPSRYTTERACAKAIYFLLPGLQVSAFHRLQCEEVWCHHVGEPLTLSIIMQDGSLHQRILGPDLEHGEYPQVIIPHNVWFGAKVNKKNGYALVSCITAPGFDFEDFELADRQALLNEYPQHKQVIELLT